ncbi:MAG: Fic family protein [Blastocatellia bacterium]|nr:Fic family protein [Blastocatellia bacterium]
MQKPPRPPILSARPTYSWISRVGQKHKRLTELDLSPQQTADLARWAEIEFVYSTLSLEGMNISRAQVARLVSSPPSDATGLTGEDAAIAGLLASLRVVETEARERGRTAALTPETLSKLHEPFGVEGEGFRKTPGEATSPFKPTPAAYLSTTIESACRWFAVESFAELSPIEQASIALLRILEIQPFERASQRTAILAASLFTLRSQLPPVIIEPGRAPAYRAALDEGARMNTTPMVELLAEVIEAALDRMIEMIEGK